MEAVLAVSSLGPRHPAEWPLDFALVDAAVRVECDPGRAWFRYRMECPVLEGDPWDEERVYAAGDQVYFTWPDNVGMGDFYKATSQGDAGDSPAIDPGKWTRIEIPFIFSNYLSWGTHADWLELDGQGSKAPPAAARAFEWLQLEFDKIERQQRQSEPWTVATH
jgi:hypothetical protein